MVVPATTTASPDGIQQYIASQELRNAMKWRRVTWDLGADFEGLAARLQDNIALLRRVPAFSHLSLHIIRDPMMPADITCSGNQA